jgi:hypothetical protein
MGAESRSVELQRRCTKQMEGRGNEIGAHREEETRLLERTKPSDLRLRGLLYVAIIKVSERRSGGAVAGTLSVYACRENGGAAGEQRLGLGLQGYQEG